MRTLVTGGHGFIGSHVMKHLVQGGHKAACFDISPEPHIAPDLISEARFIHGDVTDPRDVYSAVADFEPDRIIDLASLLGRPSQAQPRKAFSINLDGTLHVMEAAAALGVDRVVTASSVASYGPTEAETLNETVPQTPERLYGVTKRAAERAGQTIQEQSGVNFAALQPVHGFGPDRKRGNIEDAYLVKEALETGSVIVPDIKSTYEIIYVDEEAAAFVEAATANTLRYNRYIVGSNTHVSLRELADLVAKHVDELCISEASVPSGDFVTYPPTDSARLAEDTDWEATADVAAMVADYVDWLRAHPDQWEVPEAPFQASSAPS